jgi:hypothetical protein
MLPVRKVARSLDLLQKSLVEVEFKIEQTGNQVKAQAKPPTPIAIAGFQAEVSLAKVSKLLGHSSVILRHGFVIFAR